jgi:hypothetical protein
MKKILFSLGSIGTVFGSLVTMAHAQAIPTPVPFTLNSDLISGFGNLGTSMVDVAFYAILAGLAIVGTYVVSVKGFHIVLKWILGWIH